MDKTLAHIHVYKNKKGKIKLSFDQTSLYEILYVYRQLTDIFDQIYLTPP